MALDSTGVLAAGWFGRRGSVHIVRPIARTICISLLVRRILADLEQLNRVFMPLLLTVGNRWHLFAMFAKYIGSNECIANSGAWSYSSVPKALLAYGYLKPAMKGVSRGFVFSYPAVLHDFGGDQIRIHH